VEDVHQNSTNVDFWFRFRRANAKKRNAKFLIENFSSQNALFARFSRFLRLRINEISVSHSIC